MGRPDWIKVHGTDATADARYKRTAAGLSQRELAALIGSRQPVIARLGDAVTRAVQWRCDSG